MFISVLFTIAKLWKQSRCTSTGEWIKKMWYLYTMEFYSAMKKNEILSFSSKWMELENTNLCILVGDLRPIIFWCFFFLKLLYYYLLLCWMGVHWSICKSSYNVTNISYLNSPLLLLSFIISL
jgi:hypothetical protein